MIRLYGGPADGHEVDGAVHSARWLRVPVLTTEGFGYAIYERSGDVYLHIDSGEYLRSLDGLNTNPYT